MIICTHCFANAAGQALRLWVFHIGTYIYIQYRVTGNITCSIIVCDLLMTRRSSPAILAVTLAWKRPRRISNHSLMGPINLMKYICVTEIIHLKFGKSKMFLFGIQGGFPGLHYQTFHGDSLSLECFKVLWHVAFIVRPISNLPCQFLRTPQAWFSWICANLFVSVGASLFFSH